KDEDLRLGVPVGALVDPGLALDPAALRLGDVVGAGGEDVEDQAAVRQEEVARGGQRLVTLAVAAQVQVGAEGTRDERNPLVDRRPEQVAEAEVEALGDAGATRLLGADVEHPLRRVDAYDVDAGRRRRDRDPSGADAELD